MPLLKKIYFTLLDITQTILLAAAVFLVIYVFLFRPFQVSGDSMFPNFKNKEYVLTNIISLHFQKPKLGDVIVFKAPPDHSKDFIKRVIGVPGDTVTLRNGQVYLDGKLLNENGFLKPSVKSYAGAFLKRNQTITVPPNEYFVMGDNRPYSSDSREWGFVPSSYIIGESFLIYWPSNDMQFIKNPY